MNSITITLIVTKVSDVLPLSNVRIGWPPPEPTADLTLVPEYSGMKVYTINIFWPCRSDHNFFANLSLLLLPEHGSHFKDGSFRNIKILGRGGADYVE
jgi:hypothetical protein